VKVYAPEPRNFARNGLVDAADMPSFKEDDVAFRDSIGIALQDERFFAAFSHWVEGRESKPQNKMEMMNAANRKRTFIAGLCTKSQ